MSAVPPISDVKRALVASRWKKRISEDVINGSRDNKRVIASIFLKSVRRGIAAPTGAILIVIASLQ
jgi:hypothetical protein